MDAQLGSAQMGPPLAGPPIAGGWIRGGILSVLGLLWLAAVVLAARRISGAFLHPVGILPLAGSGLVLAVAAASLRTLGQQTQQQASAMLPPWLFSWGLLIPCVLVGAALWLPASSPVAIALYVLPVVAGEVWFWRAAIRPRSVRGAARIERTSQSSTPAATTLTAEEQTSTDDAEASVLQQWTRVRDAAGRDVVRGTLRADFALEERNAVLHLAFCPPFERVPQVELEAAGGADARIKPAQVLPYGARLEVRLNQPAADGDHVLVGFVARAAEPADG